MILDHLVAGAMKAVPAAQGGAIEMLHGDTLVYRAAHGMLAPHQGFRIGIEGSLSGLTLTGGQPILVDDAPLDPRADKKAAAHVGMRAALFVPMRPAGKPVGVLMLQSAEPGAFVARDLETARLFAATVPLALAEVGQAAALRSVRDSERRHRAIFESAIDYAIVVLDLDGTITNWNEGARRILGWTAAEIVVENVEVLAEQLANSPFRIIGPPAVLDFEFTDQLKAMQVVGPGGEVLYFTEIGGEIPGFDLPKAMSFVGQLFIMVLAATNVSAAGAFYAAQGRPIGPTIEAAIEIVSAAHGLPPTHRHSLATIAFENLSLLEVDAFPDGTTLRSRSSVGLPSGIAMVSVWAGDGSARDSAAGSAKPGRVTIGAAGELIEMLE